MPQWVVEPRCIHNLQIGEKFWNPSGEWLQATQEIIDEFLAMTGGDCWYVVVWDSTLTIFPNLTPTRMYKV